MLQSEHKGFSPLSLISLLIELFGQFQKNRRYFTFFPVEGLPVDFERTAFR